MSAALIFYATPLMSIVQAVTSGPGTIRACINDNDEDGTGRAIKIVGNADACKKNQTLLEWNIAGPQGPKGDKGDKGDTGSGRE